MKRKNSKLKNRLYNRLKLINLAKHKNLHLDDVLYLKKCVFNCDDTIITYHDIRCALRFNKIRKDIKDFNTASKKLESEILDIQYNIKSIKNY